MEQVVRYRIFFLLRCRSGGDRFRTSLYIEAAHCGRLLGGCLSLQDAAQPFLSLSGVRLCFHKSPIPARAEMASVPELPDSIHPHASVARLAGKVRHIAGRRRL